MKKSSLLLILLLLFATSALVPARAQSPMPVEKLAMLAALDFLELADQAEFSRCWESSSQLFREKIDKETWLQEVGHMRRQYGENRSRTLQFVKPLDPSTDSGDQPALFLIFRASFAEKTVAEMVTLSKESDQQWRVAGYSIQ
ncbi:MAG TPA: DUF4019 domain-containing protein [Malonomonas sp.]